MKGNNWNGAYLMSKSVFEGWVGCDNAICGGESNVRRE